MCLFVYFDRDQQDTHRFITGYVWRQILSMSQGNQLHIFCCGTCQGGSCRACSDYRKGHGTTLSVLHSDFFSSRSRCCLRPRVCRVECSFTTSTEGTITTTSVATTRRMASGDAAAAVPFRSSISFGVGQLQQRWHMALGTLLLPPPGRFAHTFLAHSKACRRLRQRQRLQVKCGGATTPK